MVGLATCSSIKEAFIEKKRLYERRYANKSAKQHPTTEICLPYVKTKKHTPLGTTKKDSRFHTKRFTAPKVCESHCLDCTSRGQQTAIEGI